MRQRRARRAGQSGRIPHALRKVVKVVNTHITMERLADNRRQSLQIPVNPLRQHAIRVGLEGASYGRPAARSNTSPRQDAYRPAVYPGRSSCVLLPAQGKLTRRYLHDSGCRHRSSSVHHPSSQIPPPTVGWRGRRRDGSEASSGPARAGPPPAAPFPLFPHVLLDDVETTPVSDRPPLYALPTTPF